jgi:hypothetical protein
MLAKRQIMLHLLRLLTPKRRTDDEHIERVRRQLKTLDRYGWWPFAILLVCEVIFLVVVFGAVDQFARQFQQGNFGGQRPGFWIGAMMGSLAGLAHLKIVDGLIKSLPWHRSERLLIRYHDAIMSVASKLPPEGMATPAILDEMSDATRAVEKS